MLRHVGIEPGQPEAVALAREDLVRALRPVECLVVTAQIDQGLERTAQRAPHLQIFPEPLVNSQCRLVMLQGRRVVAAQEVHVAHGAQADGPRPVVVKLFRNPKRGIGQAPGRFQVDSGQPHHFVVEAAHQVRAPPLARRLQQIVSFAFFRFYGKLL